MRKWLFLLLLLSGTFWVLQPTLARAHGHDYAAEVDACKSDPNSEECVCDNVRQFALVPIEVTENEVIVPPATPFPGYAGYDPASILPEHARYRPVDQDPPDGVLPILGLDGYWVAHPGHPDTLKDLHVPENTLNPLYKQHCTLSYFREDLRRLWYFAAALGGGFAALSLAWAGVMYMQHSASGVDLTRSRMMIMRVLLGVLILAFAFVVWEGLGDMLLDTLDPWSQDRSVFYDDVIR